jgi:hypothetical protein
MVMDPLVEGGAFGLTGLAHSKTATGARGLATRPISLRNETGTTTRRGDAPGSPESHGFQDRNALVGPLLLRLGSLVYVSRLRP